MILWQERPIGERKWHRREGTGNGPPAHVSIRIEMGSLRLSAAYIGPDALNDAHHRVMQIVDHQPGQRARVL
ncbi:MAG: hypothetical protein AAGG01_20755 [Planctomycetota bacterium]